MDPRHHAHHQPQQQQPQLARDPYAATVNRSAASPLYSRSPFPPTSAHSSNSSHSPFPSSSHPSAPPPAPLSTTSPVIYSEHHREHQRRPSDSAFRHTADHTPIPQTGAHSRHPSASSLPPHHNLHRTMPPPTSPQQPGQPPGGPHSGSYGLPPPRPSHGIGPPSAFPSSRELPALGSLARAATAGSSMSISAMLDRPSASREPGAPQQFGGATSGPGFAPPVHASPRMPSASSDYPPFRRPQTPEHQRNYDGRGARGSAAGSPQGIYHTPEVQRYSTPQVYGQRGPPLTAAEHVREQARLEDHAREQSRQAGNLPPRPSSQPRSFPGAAPPHPMDAGRPGPPEPLYGRRDELGVPVEYNSERPARALQYDDTRFMSERERQEREREMEFREREIREREMREREMREREMREREMREREIREREIRERDRRDRAFSGGDPGRPPMGVHSAEFPPRGPPAPYARHGGPRDGPWQRSYEHGPPPYDPAAPQRHPDFSPASAPPYPGGPSYASHPDRHPPPGPPTSAATVGGGSGPPHRYNSPDVHHTNLLRPQHAPPPPRSRLQDEGPPPASAAYGTANPTHPEQTRSRAAEEPPQQGQPRGLLAIQELNRKGRVSPLPQAVQGAQPQISGPAGEPGIKSEFGRMFAGIGSGLGMGLSIPVPASGQSAYTGAGSGRRDEPGNALDSPAEAAGKRGPRGKRRKIKDEDSRADDDSTGRATPSGGRAKKQKSSHNAHHHHTSHHHHHHHPHHHHHHHPDGPNLTHSNGLAYQSGKGTNRVDSPTPLGRSIHGDRAVSSSKLSATILPLRKPKRVVTSSSVLESVADRPRHHLGDFVYSSKLTPSQKQDRKTGLPPIYPYRSTPEPLPMKQIKGKENCTLTVKIPKHLLESGPREEITSRRFLWGTEVYTDDSDVIAACIHGGWIRGAWPDDVDVTMLGLDEGPDTDGKHGVNADKGPDAGSPLSLSTPPKSGPMHIPAGKDLHVTVLILPTLAKYASTTRYGIRSREWGVHPELGHQRHDGLSFMITGIKWVINGGLPQSRLRGKARRERIHRALREDLRASKHNLGILPPKPVPDETKSAVEPPKDVNGEMLQPAPEGNKENQPVVNGEIQTQTAESQAPPEEEEGRAVEEPPSAKALTDQQGIAEPASASA